MIAARGPVRMLLAALATGAVAAPALAQYSRALQVGSPVRLVGVDVPGGVLTGVLARVTRDSILVGVPGGTEAVRLPRSAVSHLYIRAGRGSGAGRGSLVGMASGLAVGSALAFAFRNQVASPGVFVILGGVGGTMLGGLIGQYVFRAPRWQEAPLSWLDEAVEEP